MLLTAEALHGVYESLPVATCVIDRSLVFLAASQRYAALLRTPLESIIGRTMIGLNPQDHIDNVRRDFRTLDQHGMVPDHEIRLWDGAYSVSVSAVGAARPAFALSVTLANVTQHVSLQRVLLSTIGELAQAQSEVTQLAHSDALTGLGNRRSLDLALAKAMPTDTPAPPGFALLMIDVDCFKAYNDANGHLAGDDCLRRIAGVLQASLESPADSAARFGGEEFVVLLPQRSVEAAARLAESIRQAILALAIDHPASPHGCVSASIGLAHRSEPWHGDLAELTRMLLHTADTALYAAKTAGRNRVCIGH
ncbi:diguanylate cyclase [Achromobacter sp. GG226]|uniref:GGDEF domain-containing protein n=1 Tax=Verticiella alkaliphila TaxID=2779529 RepID=UPI001C0D23AD|nr:sensor domain-containing diguanylate cyclase [Verticiella sp. GG226]MBU4612171.1 diguanylate cyclase [Verticiella sp. GG226]